MATRKYPRSVAAQEDRDEYDDAFNDAEADVCDGAIRNDYPKQSPGWLGYEAGVRLFSATRENWEAQTHYDAQLAPSLDMGLEY